MTHPDLPSVSPTEVGDAVLLDVREDDEWAAGRAPGALHVPMSAITGRLAEVPTDRPVAVVCHLGGRSARVTAWLLEQGVDARNVEGGMAAWGRAGLPLEADGGAVPRVD